MHATMAAAVIVVVTVATMDHLVAEASRMNKMLKGEDLNVRSDLRG